MPQAETIRPGDIRYLRDCPPLDGQSVKDRRVIVVTAPGDLPDGRIVVVCACTSTLLGRPEATDVPIPDRSKTPATKTGFAQPTWAKGRWSFPVETGRLDPVRSGYVSGPLLERVTKAVAGHLKL